MSTSGEGRTLHKRTHRLIDFGGRGTKKTRRKEKKEGTETEEKIKAIYECGLRELAVKDESLPVHAKWCFQRKTGYTRCLCLSKFIFDYVDVDKLDGDTKGSSLGESREWLKWKKIRPPIKLVRRKAIEEIADDLGILSKVRDDLMCLDPKGAVMLRRFFEHFSLEVKSSKEMYFRLNRSSTGRVFCWQSIRVLLNCLEDPRGKEEGFAEAIWNNWMARGGGEKDSRYFRRYGKKVYVCCQIWTLYMKEWQKWAEVGGRLFPWVDEVPRMSKPLFLMYREEGGSVGNMNTLKSHYAVALNKLVKQYRNVLVAHYGWTGGSGVVYETRGVGVEGSRNEVAVRHKNNIRCTLMVSEIVEKVHALAWMQQDGHEGLGSMESAECWLDPRKLKGADPIQKHMVDTFESLLTRGICAMVAEGGGVKEQEVEDLFTVDCRIRSLLSCFTTEKRGVDMFHLVFSDDEISWAADHSSFLFCCYVPVDKCGMWLRIKPWLRLKDDTKLAETLELIGYQEQLKRRVVKKKLSLNDYDGMWLYVPNGMAVLLPSSLYHASDLCTSLQGNRYLQVLVYARRNREATGRSFWADVDSDSWDVGRKNFLCNPHYISVGSSDGTEACEWCTENLKEFMKCMVF